MQIQINTDNHIQNTESLRERIEAIATQELKHQRQHLTRVEYHLSDVNSGKAGAEDKRCLVEARPAGMQPVSAEHRADNIVLAITEATRQLNRVLTSAIGKAQNK
ncbi:MAG: HPF/RaiA family ribosome-associated protein [Alcaligenaceae bacterium]|uniref:HPF/RaiA family ribosome-associated protein n=1 Tax=Paenalcaligenes hermetiae TaxID=1157987 RepID=A0ABP9LU93_9BURK|nr:HPF/RaiA family ribosome-associated protein [Paenalcaligenes sp.]NLJ62107.1 HPF/RaiA family ribosome-associated protein [Alcaligenaceae bacterium]